MGVGSLVRAGLSAISKGANSATKGASKRLTESEAMAQMGKHIRDVTTPRTTGQEQISTAARGTRAVREATRRGAATGAGVGATVGATATAMAAAKGKSKEVSAAKGKAAANKMGRVADTEAKLANMKKRSTSVRNKALASSTPSVKAPSPKSFNSAFAEAYKAGQKTFTYKGKKYTTAKKGSK